MAKYYSSVLEILGNCIKHLYLLLQHRFANGPCDGDGKNGTCYTEQECQSRGGEGQGSCAEGYGVCCICERLPQ